MSKRVKATPAEEAAVKQILQEKPKPVVKVEPVKVEPAKICVFCGAKSTNFLQPGKEYRGKWVCPECVLNV
jgi:hypothetical protein